MSEFWIENHVAEKAVRPKGALLELGVVRSEGLLIFNLIAPSFSDLVTMFFNILDCLGYRKYLYPLAILNFTVS